MIKLKKGVVVYKAAYTKYTNLREKSKVLITLYLPKGTLCRFQPRPGKRQPKNRASQAKVRSILNLTTKEQLTRAYAGWDGSLYQVGKMKKPRRSFDESSDVCASGIHFFATRSQAEAYNP